MAIDKQYLERNAEEIKSKAEQVGSDLKGKANEIKEAVADYFKENSAIIKDKAEKVNDNIVDYIRDNPWKAIGWSALAGVVISSVLKRK